MGNLKLGRGDGRGQALVEFAIILPIFILLLVGILDLSRAVYANHTIANAAREALRLAIVDQNQSLIEAHGIQRASGLGLAAEDVTVRFLNPDLTEAAPCGQAEPIAPPVEVGCVAEIQIVYQYTAATPIISNLVGPIDMFSTARQPVERKFATP